MALLVKNPLANAGDVRDTGLISGLGRSSDGGNGNPLQYFCGIIPWTEEPGGLQSIGSQKSSMTEQAHFLTLKEIQYENKISILTLLI